MSVRPSVYLSRKDSNCSVVSWEKRKKGGVLGDDSIELKGRLHSRLKSLKACEGYASQAFHFYRFFKQYSINQFDISAFGTNFKNAVFFCNNAFFYAKWCLQTFVVQLWQKRINGKKLKREKKR